MRDFGECTANKTGTASDEYLAHTFKRAVGFYIIFG
jgi:hypothetical protein